MTMDETLGYMMVFGGLRCFLEVIETMKSLEIIQREILVLHQQRTTLSSLVHCLRQQ